MAGEMIAERRAAIISTVVVVLLAGAGVFALWPRPAPTAPAGATAVSTAIGGPAAAASGGGGAGAAGPGTTGSAAPEARASAITTGGRRPQRRHPAEAGIQYPAR